MHAYAARGSFNEECEMKNSRRNLRTSVTALLVATLLGVTGGCVEKEKPKGGGVATKAADEGVEYGFDETEADVAVAEIAAEPVDQTPIRCNVAALRGHQPTIQWVIENGTEVEKGDVLVQLDTLGIEEAIAAVTAQTHIARVEVVKAESTLSLARIALTEFVEGVYPLEEQRIKAEIFEAEILLRQAGDNELAAERAKVHLALAKKKFEVHSRFTKPGRTEELNAAITVAKADLAARTENLQLLAGRRDHLLKQLESCVVKAPQSGRVVLADESGIRPGTVVRRGQTLIYLQDAD